VLTNKMNWLDSKTEFKSIPQEVNWPLVHYRVAV
jgi:hypothetical protein